MDITILDELVPKLEELQREDLMLMLKSLESLLTKTREQLTAQEELPPRNNTPSKVPSSVAAEFYQHLPHPLEDNLFSGVHKHLKTLHYRGNPKNPKSPEILLYGDHQYKYNEQSANLVPIPIQTDPIMSELLNTVNAKLGANYNSMLVNKYRNVNCYLGPHKDDEPCLDPSVPIATLSLGATRRLHIAADSNKHKAVDTIILSPKSIFCMLPGFQERFYHSVAAGRKSNSKEKGTRYSVTFRHIPPGSVVPALEATEPASLPEIVATPATEANTTEPTSFCTGPDTLVFGSSLTKNLDEQLLSKHTRNFKVFSNSGAEVRDIYEDVKKVQAGKEIDTSNVKCVFLLCGGNDIENIRRDADITYVWEDMEDLVDLTREVFPLATLNIISMIPRRSKYRSHIRNMHAMNTWLYSFCKKEAIRFVDIFSFFVVKWPDIWLLSTKLFNGGKLHFNAVGDSVLAKVLIGVANSPK